MSTYEQDLATWEEDQYALFHDIVPQLIDASERWVVLFCALEALGAYQTAAGERWIRAGLWVKPDSTPQFTGDRPAQPGEGIAIMHRVARKRWNGRGRVGLWSYCIERKDRVHETQKPIGLMLDLVSLFSDAGETVWDPYCGSGTTGVAALRLGRQFIGHEAQPEYAEVAAERLRAEERGLSLRDARRGQTSIFDAMEEG